MRWTHGCLLGVLLAAGCMLDANPNLLVPFDAPEADTEAPPEDTGADATDAPSDAAPSPTSASDRCAEAPLLDRALRGSTRGLRADTVSGCQNAAKGATPGPDVFARVRLAAGEDLDLDTVGSSFDTVVSVRRACDGVELGCSNNADVRTGHSHLVLRRPGQGDYLAVLGGSLGASGDYVLRGGARAAPAQSVCGPTEVDLGQGGTVLGTTAGLTNTQRAPGDCSTGAVGLGPDEAYRFTVGVAGRVGVRVETIPAGAWQPVVWVRSACDGGRDHGCSEAAPGRSAELYLDLAPGEYHVVVDGVGARDAGSYRLVVALGL